MTSALVLSLNIFYNYLVLNFNCNYWKKYNFKYNWIFFFLFAFLKRTRDLLFQLITVLELFMSCFLVRNIFNISLCAAELVTMLDFNVCWQSFTHSTIIMFWSKNNKFIFIARVCIYTICYVRYFIALPQNVN